MNGYKEKAKDIYDKMLQWQDDARIYIERNIVCTSAVKCAIISVDEIISCISIINKIEGKRMDSAAIKFYEGVKQELEKM